MEKGANVVLVSLLALVGILIVFLVLEFEQLDVSFEGAFNWITINSTVPQKETLKNETDWSKINNTKPVLIKPNENKLDDVSYLFPEPYDQNWYMQNLFDYSDYDFGWEIQEMQERYYYNKEKPLMAQVAIMRTDNEKDAVILYEHEKNLDEEGMESSEMSYDLLKYDIDSVMSIDADNCHAFKMLGFGGNTTVFIVNCQKKEFYYSIHTEASMIELPESLAIEFANEVSSRIS